MTEEEKIGMISKYTDKGFGFLENGLFFHISQIPEEIHAFLEEGLMVNYTEVQGEKGPVAKISSTVDGLESAEVEAPKFSGEYVIIDPQKILFEDTIQRIETIIELNGAILIPGILRRFPNSFGRIKKNQEFDVVDKIETHLKEAFDNLSVSKYDLFRPKNKTDGTSITGHPYLQETSPFTWLIRKKSVNVNFNPRKKIPDALLQFIYSHIIEQDEDCWVVVGDETGDLGEFMGKKPGNHQASMGWVIIPPKSDLPSLPPSFHVHEDEEHMNIATDYLLSSRGVQLYQFQYASGTRIEGVPSESAQSHLNFWKDTLPLVLNKISEHSEVIPKVRIYIERVGELEPGINPVTALLSNWKLAMGDDWVNIEKAIVLAKNPLEHPWLGYPDAVGFINSPRSWNNPELKTKIAELKKRLVESPYRQYELGKINGLFMTKQPPVQFVKALFDFPQRDMKEYIVEYYGQQLKQRIEVLTERDWYVILEEMEQHSGGLQGQNATSVIFDHTNIEQTLSKLRTDSLKFTFLMALMGCSNHNGDTDRSQFCKINIGELMDSEFKPTRQQRMHFLNLSNGANDNEFDFSIDDEEIQLLMEQVQDGFQDDIERKLAGAYAQTLGLRCTDDDLELAWEIEELLRTDSVRDPFSQNHARRLNIKAELLLARNENIRARTFMEVDLPDEISNDLLSIVRTDGFFLACLLKSCTLCEEDSTKFMVYSSYVEAMLDNRHPSQRIAYWTVRWAWQLGLESHSVVQVCIDHLIGMTSNEIFTKEAPGLILSCELLHLSAIGLIGFDADEFHKTVLKNSTQSTRDWVELNPPNDDDWLAPLTYNYR
ncbi:MAG: cold-shock protein [Candidatus Poseidoniaceae archaeon]